MMRIGNRCVFVQGQLSVGMPTDLSAKFKGCRLSLRTKRSRRVCAMKTGILEGKDFITGAGWPDYVCNYRTAAEFLLSVVLG